MTTRRPAMGTVEYAWLKHQGLAPQQVLARTGGRISKSYLSQLRHGKIKLPSDEYLTLLADALGIDVSVLLTRTMPGESDQYRPAREPTPVPLPRLREGESAYVVADVVDVVEAAFEHLRQFPSARVDVDDREQFEQLRSEAERSLERLARFLRRSRHFG